MKIVIVNTNQSMGGAAKAALRLFQSLRTQKGVVVNYLVSTKASSDPDVLCPWPTFSHATTTLLYLLDSFVLRFYPKRKRMLFSLNRLPTKLSSLINNLNPDIVHFHWINFGFIPIEEYERIKCPIVWTLHDSWVFTGGCHLPSDCTKYEQHCGACPQLGSSELTDLSYKTWERKKSAYAKIKLSVITPSRWLASCAQKSSLLKNWPIRVIPNGIDLEIFCPSDRKEERKRLGLPENKKLILLSAFGIESDPNKGLHLFDALFKDLKNAGLTDLEFLILGTKKVKKNTNRIFPVHDLGTLKDERRIAQLYQAVDLTLLLSRQENLPFTVMESLACGTPAVAFHVGGIPDIIEHQINGYLAKPFSIEDIAAGIKWCLEDKGRYVQLALKARKKCEENFSLEQLRKSYLSLYHELQR